MPQHPDYQKVKPVGLAAIKFLLEGGSTGEQDMSTEQKCALLSMSQRMEDSLLRFLLSAQHLNCGAKTPTTVVVGSPYGGPRNCTIGFPLHTKFGLLVKSPSPGVFTMETSDGAILADMEEH